MCQARRTSCHHHRGGAEGTPGRSPGARRFSTATAQKQVRRRREHPQGGSSLPMTTPPPEQTVPVPTLDDPRRRADRSRLVLCPWYHRPQPCVESNSPRSRGRVHVGSVTKKITDS